MGIFIVLMGLAGSLPADSLPAGELAEGDFLRIYYGDLGFWNDPIADAGFQARFLDDWIEISNAGAPYHLLAVGGMQGTTPIHGFINGWEHAGNLSLLETDHESPEGWVRIRFRHGIGGLEIDRIEEWERSARILRVRLSFENVGTEPIEDLRFLYAFESDPENNPIYDEDKSANDVLDLDGDGVMDFVESAGIVIGLSTGIGACAQTGVELGHFGEWGGVSHADEPLLDENGRPDDWAMGLRTHFAEPLLPGEHVEAVFLISTGATPEESRNRYKSARVLCTDLGYTWKPVVAAPPADPETRANDAGASETRANDTGASEETRANGTGSSAGCTQSKSPANSLFLFVCLVLFVGLRRYSHGLM
jgi:hypothetical protein